MWAQARPGSAQLLHAISCFAQPACLCSAAWQGARAAARALGWHTVSWGGAGGAWGAVRRRPRASPAWRPAGTGKCVWLPCSEHTAAPACLPAARQRAGRTLRLPHHHVPCCRRCVCVSVCTLCCLSSSCPSSSRHQRVSCELATAGARCCWLCLCCSCAAHAWQEGAVDAGAGCCVPVACACRARRHPHAALQGGAAVA